MYPFSSLRTILYQIYQTIFHTESSFPRIYYPKKVRTLIPSVRPKYSEMY